jgi:anthranilate synthase component 1
MKLAEFKRLAEQGYNRIPLVREVLADLDTPLSTYLKLADAPYSYLLESVHGGEKWGRYSIIGLPSETVVRITGQDIEVKHHGKVIEQTTSSDPLSWNITCQI